MGRSLPHTEAKIARARHGGYYKGIRERRRSDQRKKPLRAQTLMSHPAFVTANSPARWHIHSSDLNHSFNILFEVVVGTICRRQYYRTVPLGLVIVYRPRFVSPTL